MLFECFFPIDYCPLLTTDSQGRMHNTTCPLPHITIPENLDALSINVSGTECYDFSSMGTQRQLAGPTSRTLAIWICQRRRAKEDPHCYLVAGNHGLLCAVDAEGGICGWYMIHVASSTIVCVPYLVMRRIASCQLNW